MHGSLFELLVGLLCYALESSQLEIVANEIFQWKQKAAKIKDTADLLIWLDQVPGQRLSS